jgi:hypothetical protein
MFYRWTPLRESAVEDHQVAVVLVHQPLQDPIPLQDRHSPLLHHNHFHNPHHNHRAASGEV